MVVDNLGGFTEYAAHEAISAIKLHEAFQPELRAISLCQVFVDCRPQTMFSDVANGTSTSVLLTYYVALGAALSHSNIAKRYLVQMGWHIWLNSSQGTILMVAEVVSLAEI